MKLRKIRSFSKDEIRELIILSENRKTRASLMEVYNSFEEDNSFVHVISDADLERIRTAEVVNK